MSTPYNRNIQATVIHHMGDGKPPDVSILKRWNPSNYEFPEYDFGIEADGTIREGRPLNYQGAHCLSDKPPYSTRGNQWWNQNSIGIGLAGDFTKYPMPQIQFNALVSLVKRLNIQYGLTLDDVYPHGQVTNTACPGCVYDKVPALSGWWNYNEFEQAVLGNVQQKEEVGNVLSVAVLIYSRDDYIRAGADIAAKYGNCGVFVRSADLTAPADAWNAKQLIVVGGKTTGHQNELLLSGNGWYETVAAVGKYLG
jgi:hypothetical protein